jgi:uncharacterized membrane protein
VSCDGHRLAIKLPVDPGRAHEKEISPVPSSRSGVTDSVSTAAAYLAPATKTLVNTAATVGVIAAGIALLDLALIPGMVVGGAAVLAPSLLPKLRRGLRPVFNATFAQRPGPKAAGADLQQGRAPIVDPNRFTIKQAIAKTITFRVIVTSIDFTVNYVVLGEFATAAGLSAFALVVGPLFYLVHETAWNYFGDADKRVDLTILLPSYDTDAQPLPGRGFTISRALAKTITFRTIATTMDFATNFVVVGDLATAATLSASGFILGPFVYFGHERLWDYYGSPEQPAAELEAPLKLLPAAG